MNTMKQFRQAGIKVLVVMAATIAAVASVVVFFDPQTGYVVSITNTGALTNAFVPTNSLPPGHPTEWILSGEVLRLMTQEEMAARDLWRDQTNQMRLRAEARFKLTNDIAIIAALNVMLDLVNTNRLMAGKPAVTDEQFIELVGNEIELH